MIYGYEVRSGAEVVEHHRTHRHTYAQALREERQSMRALNAEHDFPFDAATLNKIVRSNVQYRLGHITRLPFRPTLDNFREAATNCYDYSESSWYNHLDTEYYSACGYDDYMGEKRDYARVQAIEYFRAWKYMKAQAYD